MACGTCPKLRVKGQAWVGSHGTRSHHLSQTPGLEPWWPDTSRLRSKNNRGHNFINHPQEAKGTYPKNVIFRKHIVETKCFFLPVSSSCSSKCSAHLTWKRSSLSNVELWGRLRAQDIKMKLLSYKKPAEKIGHLVVFISNYTLKIFLLNEWVLKLLRNTWGLNGCPLPFHLVRNWPHRFWQPFTGGPTLHQWLPPWHPSLH